MGLEKSYPRVIITTTMNFQGNAASDMWYILCISLTVSLEGRYDYFNFKN